LSKFVSPTHSSRASSHSRDSRGNRHSQSWYYHWWCVSTGSRHFEDQEIEGLRRREAELRSKLGELFKNRPKPNEEEGHVANIARIEADLQVVKDDLVSPLNGSLSFSFSMTEFCFFAQSSTDLRLKGIKDELKVLRTKVKELGKTLSTLEKNSLRSRLKPNHYEKSFIRRRTASLPTSVRGLELTISGNTRRSN